MVYKMQSLQNEQLINSSTWFGSVESIQSVLYDKYEKLNRSTAATEAATAAAAAAVASDAVLPQWRLRQKGNLINCSSSCGIIYADRSGRIDGDANHKYGKYFLYVC